MAQQQALITITGYVGANPTQFNKDGMPHASSFRMASTRRYFDNRTQQWKDLPTTWITVKAYRNLSENICQSLKKGEPVIVMGSLATETWTDMNGKPQSRIVLEASAAGHDLNRGVTTLRKFVKPNDQAQPETKGMEPQVGVDPFVRHGSVAPVEIVVPEDDEAAEFSGDPEEFGGDIHEEASLPCTIGDDCLLMMRLATRCARADRDQATCRPQASHRTPCRTGQRCVRCRSCGIQRGNAGRSADTAPPARHDSWCARWMHS